MATQNTVVYQSGNGSTITVVWDDVAMVISFLAVHIAIEEPASLQFNGVVGVQPITLSYTPGTDTTWTPPGSIPVVRTTDKRGDPSVQFAGVNVFGVAGAQ